jgi:nucleotide-binding universal stress UspA family protein
VTRVADELDAPLIVLGSRGLTGVKEMLNGSVLQSSRQTRWRPVMVVPPANGAHMKYNR